MWESECLNDEKFYDVIEKDEASIDEVNDELVTSKIKLFVAAHSFGNILESKVTPI